MTENTDTRIRRLGYRAPLLSLSLDRTRARRTSPAGAWQSSPSTDRMPTRTRSLRNWRAQLIEILETIAARSSVRVAILTGAGDRAFSVGGDLPTSASR